MIDRILDIPAIRKGGGVFLLGNTRVMGGKGLISLGSGGDVKGKLGVLDRGSTALGLIDVTHLEERFAWVSSILHLLAELT